MLESMKKLISDLDMLPRGCTVLCAVSGGMDSICLLHALYQLRPELGFHLAAAHYNHKLRGEDSLQDARFVAQFVELCCGPQAAPDGSILPAVPLFLGEGDVAEAAKARSAGIEETARSMRYDFLRQTAREVGADRIATAHNADDNAETILFHLARGSGLRGLTGIAPMRGDLIRPLLTTPRREIEAYLFSRALPHREDQTNNDQTYSRNRIRWQVTPVLEELFPGFAQRITDSAARLRADEAYLCAQAEEIATLAQSRPDGLSIPADAIAQAPAPLAVRAVRSLIGRINGGDQNCSAAHLESVVQLCRSSDPSAQIDLPYGLTARREYDCLILSRTDGIPELSPTPLPLPGTATAGGWKVTCRVDRYTGAASTPWDFWLSRTQIPSLTLRPRQTGDRLTLPGRPGKSVKKWCIDEKIPRALRDSLPVLDYAGQPTAVVGLGPDVAFLPRPGEEAWHICADRIGAF